ncbi:adhesin biosynthesis transcription regulatory family protein [Yersinia pestis subsp. pestis]|nr:PapB/FocB family fimbrial expression transcriptional regulator [Yersinia pestis]MCF2952556.1 adhesin biosynthesis transcription regulatory family protein [Yersinia pestis subsp. pestis]MCF2960271.1 adhesin biosynthesis transcription regulatory family protein [Yersinia pestis subsp. pestis]
MLKWQATTACEDPAEGEELHRLVADIPIGILQHITLRRQFWRTACAIYLLGCGFSLSDVSNRMLWDENLIDKNVRATLQRLLGAQGLRLLLMGCITQSEISQILRQTALRLLYFSHYYESDAVASYLQQGQSLLSASAQCSPCELFQGRISPGEVDEVQLTLLMDIAKVTKISLRAALHRHLVEGATEEWVCSVYKMNQEDFWQNMRKLHRLNERVVQLLPFYTRQTSSCMCVGCPRSPQPLTDVSSS